MVGLGESKIYEFGGFRFDVRSRRLSRGEGSEAVPLTPKAAELLLALIEGAGRVLTKDELLERVWGDSFVEESNLSQTVFVLRKTLGESRKEPHIILTVPNRGYRFIATVREFSTGDGGSAETTKANLSAATLDTPPATEFTRTRPKVNAKRARYFLFAIGLGLLTAFGIYQFQLAPKHATLPEVKSIAILPFEDLSVEQTEKYLGVSLTDALVKKFGGLKQITVRPTRTVLQYADSRERASVIGRELGVDALLDGRIQRVGDQVRVSVQLVRTSDDKTIWTENFDDRFTNFFAVQDSISQRVVQSLALQLDDAERERFNRRGTENSAAYQEYLRGRFFWNKRTSEGLQKAIEHFNRAIALDPNFAQAYSALAETYVLVNLFGTHHDREAFPRARVAVEQALRLDDKLAEAHAALAQIRMQHDFDWAGTEAAYRKALELNPNNAIVRQWYGEFLALQNRTAESLAQMERARELDPTSLSINNAFALPLLVAHESDKALAVTEKALEMDANFPWALHYRCRAFLQKEDFRQAIEFCDKALAASNQSLYMKANLAYVHARAGRTTEARRILAELKATARTNHVSPYNFAMIHSALGEQAATLMYLNQAAIERDFLIPALKNDACFLNLRDDSQFKEILRRVNL